MARITVEDCLEEVNNRFELVLLATQRARQLVQGREASVPIENDKMTIVALREIAAGHITKQNISEIEKGAQALVEPTSSSTSPASPFGEPKDL